MVRDRPGDRRRVPRRVQLHPGSGDASHPLRFSVWLDRGQDFWAEATIESIWHAELGELRAILTGLDYRFVTMTGTCFKIEAEEPPGLVHAFNRKLVDLNFEVSLSDFRRKADSAVRSLRRAEQVEFYKQQRARLTELAGACTFVERG